MYDPNAFYTPPQPEYYPRYPAPPQDHDWQPQATERQSRQLRSVLSAAGSVGLVLMGAAVLLVPLRKEKT
jgi:hypothetical protein